MFQDLSKRLTSALSKLKRQGVVREADLDQTLREIRIALLEADVALPAVKSIVQGVKDEALGQKVLASLSPGHIITKIVHEHIIKLLGESGELNLHAPAPVPIMVAGLQGSGKTTTCGKLASYLTNKLRKRVYMVSLDVYRPAAQQQLEQLGSAINVATAPIIEGQKPLDICKRAFEEARRHVADVILFDTAGRQHLDETMMDELVELQKAIKPIETILVLDGTTGQDAVRTAQGFQDRIELTSLILSRMDSDARGGATLSLRFTTQCPIRFLGTGEKPDQLTVFDAKRMADRMMDQGDMVQLVEQASALMDEDVGDMEQALMKGESITLEHMLVGFKKVVKLGGVSKIMGMLPGTNQIMDKQKVDEKQIYKFIAIIQSMTPKERKFPNILNASRKKRIARGSGVDVAVINRLVMQHSMMAKLSKQFASKKGLFKSFKNKMLGK